MKSPYKRIAVKVGSNVLTRADGTLDITRMSAIVDQIAQLRNKGMDLILISSGAVTSGRNELHIPRKMDAVSERQLYSAVGQAKLINRYYELFREHGIACGQVLTTKENFSTRRHYLNQKHCMEVMLYNNVIPVVNENDTVSLTELMFTDNDELSGLVASMMDMDMLVILSNIDGIYDGNPEDERSKVITDIYHDTDASSFIQDDKSPFGRGGMATKYRIARKVANEGITVVIANGRRDNILLDIAATKRVSPYTLFHAAKGTSSGIKKWIANSEGFAKGEIHVDEGAAKALLSAKGSSLLSVGITKISGDFEKGDIVKVISPSGETFAIGRVDYDAESARAIIGVGGMRPVIHNDYIYIDQIGNE